MRGSPDAIVVMCGGREWGMIWCFSTYQGFVMLMKPARSLAYIAYGADQIDPLPPTDLRAPNRRETILRRI